jgi:hypothetical protein
MFIAVIALFLLPDLPHNSRGFTEEERLVAQLRIIEDVGEADTDDKDAGIFDGFFMAVKDLKVYLMIITLIAFVIMLSFNAFFRSFFPTAPSDQKNPRKQTQTKDERQKGGNSQNIGCRRQMSGCQIILCPFRCCLCLGRREELLFAALSCLASKLKCKADP